MDSCFSFSLKEAQVSLVVHGHKKKNKTKQFRCWTWAFLASAPHYPFPLTIFRSLKRLMSGQRSLGGVMGQDLTYLRRETVPRVYPITWFLSLT